MAQNGIVTGGRRVLKPLVWLLLAAGLLIAASLLWFELKSPMTEASAAQLVLDSTETLARKDILFQQTETSTYSQTGFTPLVIYEVALRGSKMAFSKPFTLNFYGKPEPGLSVARRDKERWLKLEGAIPGEHAGVALSIKLDKPGIYAMGRFAR